MVRKTGTLPRSENRKEYASAEHGRQQGLKGRAHAGRNERVAAPARFPEDQQPIDQERAEKGEQPADME